MKTKKICFNIPDLTLPQWIRFILTFPFMLFITLVVYIVAGLLVNLYRSVIGVYYLTLDKVADKENTDKTPLFDEFMEKTKF